MQNECLLFEHRDDDVDKGILSLFATLKENLFKV
jgi:hypothetical protein